MLLGSQLSTVVKCQVLCFSTFARRLAWFIMTFYLRNYPRTTFVKQRCVKLWYQTLHCGNLWCQTFLVHESRDDWQSKSMITLLNTYLGLDIDKNMGSGDSSVVRAPDSWSKGRGFESLLERWENFLLHGQLSVLTLISVSVPPPCYRSST